MTRPPMRSVPPFPVLSAYVPTKHPGSSSSMRPVTFPTTLQTTSTCHRSKCRGGWQSLDCGPAGTGLPVSGATAPLPPPPPLVSCPAHINPILNSDQVLLPPLFKTKSILNWYSTFLIHYSRGTRTAGTSSSLPCPTTQVPVEETPVPDSRVLPGIEQA